MSDKTQNPGTHLPHDENKSSRLLSPAHPGIHRHDPRPGCSLLYHLSSCRLGIVATDFSSKGQRFAGEKRWNPHDQSRRSRRLIPDRANRFRPISISGHGPARLTTVPAPALSSTGGYDPTSSGGTNYGPLNDELIDGATTQPAAPATQPTTQVAATTPHRLLSRQRCWPSMASACGAIHYAVANNIAFKLYHVKPDGTRVDEVPLSKFEDSSGNLLDTALVDAFPHPPSDAADKVSVIAADFAVPIPGDAVTASGSGLDPHISPANARLQTHRVAAARGIKDDQVAKLIDAHTDGPSWDSW